MAKKKSKTNSVNPHYGRLD